MGGRGGARAEVLPAGRKGERPIGGCLATARLKSLRHLMSPSSLLKGQQSLPHFLNFLDPHSPLPESEQLSGFQLFFVSSADDTSRPSQLPNLSPTQLSNAGPWSFPVLPSIHLGSRARSPQKEIGCASHPPALIPLTVPFQIQTTINLLELRSPFQVYLPQLVSGISGCIWPTFAPKPWPHGVRQSCSLPRILSGAFFCGQRNLDMR